MRKGRPRPPARAASPAAAGVSKGAPTEGAPPHRGAIAPGLVIVGRFGAPQGVRGEVRIKAFTQDPLSVGTYGELTDATGRRAFRITGLRPLREDMLVATVEGIADRTAAESLTNLDLFARREHLPAPDEDEVYVSDLVGLAARDTADQPVGTIIGVENYGAGDILEIATGANGDTLLVPFTKAFVPELDLAAGRVTIVVPVDDADGETEASG